MDTPSSYAQELRLDEHGYIDEDCYCVGCGYNLRGLNPESICPECATPIGRSAHGDFLRFSDPTWVETLAEGMQWIVAGIILSIVVGACVGGGAAALGAGTGNMQAGILVAGLVSLAITLVYLVGYWKVTTPDPGMAGPEEGITARQVVRFWAVANVILTPIEQFIPPELIQFSIPIGLISGVIGIAGTIAIFLYAITLAERIPDLKLARDTRIVMWGTVICTALALLGGLAILAVGPGMLAAPGVGGPAGGGAGGPSQIMLAIFGGFCVVGVAGLVFGIWAIVLAFRYRSAFRTAAEQARASWMRETQESQHGYGAREV